MDLLTSKRLGTQMHPLSEAGDGMIPTLMLSRNAKHMIEPRKHQLLQCGATLGCNDLGPMQDLLRKIDGGFHMLMIQEYGHIAIF